MASKKSQTGAPEVPGTPIVGVEADPLQIGTIGAEGQAAAPKPAESKADRFKRLASRRVAKAIKVLSQVRSLSNRCQYDYTSEMVGKIMAALNDSVKQIGNAFLGVSKSAETFQL